MKLHLFICFAIFTTASCSGHWDYLKQDQWVSSFPECGGNAQSPIDIQDVCLPGSQTRVNTSLKVNLLNYNSYQPTGFTLTNNGHTAELSLNEGKSYLESAPKITGPAADNQLYQFAQLHFHWDQNDTEGSEHSFHGVRRALEMHLVHWNVKYGSFDKAAGQADGLLVFGVLFHAGVNENPLLDPIVDHLAEVHKFNSKVNVDDHQLTLASVLPPSYQTFYRYRGSLTTPPCSESVNWLLVAELENIGYSQLFEFAKLDNQENRVIGNTNRDLHKLNGRIVEASSNAHCSRRPRRVRLPFKRPRLNNIPDEFHHPDPNVRARIEHWLSTWM